jgi:NAD(P)-dependent dehydrogenase (short-subunit alcohol dehydrogenase family)
MDIRSKHVVITGAGRGIGAAVAHRFTEEGARALVLADFDLDAAQEVATALGDRATAVQIDAGSAEDVTGLVDRATETNGPIDLYFSNAGLGGPAAGPEASDESWDTLWRVHVMSHVWASRALIPAMTARGGGYLVNTASAAGLLTQPSALPYTVTKHAAVALAEWMAVNYAEAGIRSSCVCPQAVQTRLLDEAMGQTKGASAAVAAGGVLTAEEVAEAILKGVLEERVLILPHGSVADRVAYKATHHEAWVGELRGLLGGGGRSTETSA